MSPNLAEPEIKSIGAWEEFFQWTSNHSIVVVGFERKTTGSQLPPLLSALKGYSTVFVFLFLFGCFFGLGR